MWGMGLLPEEALIDGFAGPTFGLECAGIVREVGPGVDGLAVGDRVAGFAPAALATRVTTAAHAVIRIPDETSFAAAATMPVAFVTAIYALGTLGKLERGRVRADPRRRRRGRPRGDPVRSPARRDRYRDGRIGGEAGFPSLAGADHVLDSRDLGFADAVRAITGGSGVDVVLNSLSGEAMETSLGVLKPFGRFLELGKRDFYQNRPHAHAPAAAEHFLFRDRRGPAADPAARSRPRVAERDCRGVEQTARFVRWRIVGFRSPASPTPSV